jgi:transcriptional/translational regulatory protein YebC/TACO1
MLAAALTPRGPEHEVIASELAYLPKETSRPSDDEVPNRVAALVEQLEQDLDCLRVWTSLGFRV